MTVQTDLWDLLRNEVYVLTNRPTLVAETDIGIRQGILRAHLIDHFPRDYAITPWVPDPLLVTTPTTAPSVDTTQPPFVRYRDCGVFVPTDSEQNPMYGIDVELVEINNIYEPGYPGVRKPNIVYQAGMNLVGYIPGGCYGAQIGYYQLPNVTRDTVDSWIAQLFPDVITWFAARFVWNRSGNDAKGKEADSMLGDKPPINFSSGLYHDLRANFLTGIGR